MIGKRRIIFWVMVMGFFLSTAASAGDLDRFTGEAGRIRIAGGTAHIPVMKAVAVRIMRRYPDIHISIAGGGSGVGIKQVGEGLIDIGNSGRKPKKKEIARYGLKMFKWAVDGVGIVVHPANPVRSLSSEQIRAIFAGTITRWQAVGGQNAPIHLYTRDESSGTRAVFWKKALNKGPMIGHANVVVSNGAMKAAVSQDPFAVGYVSVGHMDDSVAGVSLDGMAPTLENIRSGRYPVARGLYSNTRGEPAGLVKKFIDYLFSADGQALVARHDLVPVR